MSTNMRMAITLQLHVMKNLKCHCSVDICLAVNDSEYPISLDTSLSNLNPGTVKNLIYTIPLICTQVNCFLLTTFLYLSLLSQLQPRGLDKGL